MNKWYSICKEEDNIIVASRIQLYRNLDGYSFPVTMPEQEQKELTKKLLTMTDMLQELEGMKFEGCKCEEFSDTHIMAIKERQLIKKNSINNQWPKGVIASEDESVSIEINGDEHLCIQVSERGLSLHNCLLRINEIDDAINKEYSYAFDETFGYLTSNVKNLGTGMKVSIVLHLPLLSISKKWEDIQKQMDKDGMELKEELHGEEKKASGLYVLSSKRTLGNSEEDIILQVMDSCKKLVKAEQEIRSSTKHSYFDDMAEGVYRAYGILKFARMLSEKECYMYLTKLWLGIKENIISFSEEANIYEWMLKIQPCSLQVDMDRPMKEEEIQKARATYIRKVLTDLKEMI